MHKVEVSKRETQSQVKLIWNSRTMLLVTLYMGHHAQERQMRQTDIVCGVEETISTETEYHLTNLCNALCTLSHKLTGFSAACWVLQWL